MIFDTILNFLANIFIGLVSLLPTASATPTGLEAAWNWIGGIVAGIVYVLNGIPGEPGTQLMRIIIAMMFFLFAMFVWMIIKIIFNAIRGSGV